MPPETQRSPRTEVIGGHAATSSTVAPSATASGPTDCECFHDVLDQDATTGPGSWKITISPPSDDEVTA